MKDQYLETFLDMLFQDITTSLRSCMEWKPLMLSLVSNYEANTRPVQELLAEEQNKQGALSDVEGNSPDEH
jgi:hypothetical protein